MNTLVEPASLQLPAIGAPFEGGFFAGLADIDGARFAIIVAPKFDGEHDDIAWNDSEERVTGAQSYCDGSANTLAMKAAGSALAGWALDLRIGGFDDWYLPSQDELEICYRAFKPTSDRNYLWARSGINLSAVPPTRPYTAEFPVQTALEAFQRDGAETFDPTWYWTSTQHAGDDDHAWSHDFYYGDQLLTHKANQFRARAVRRVAI